MTTEVKAVVSKNPTEQTDQPEAIESQFAAELAAIDSAQRRLENVIQLRDDARHSHQHSQEGALNLAIHQAEIELNAAYQRLGRRVAVSYHSKS